MASESLQIAAVIVPLIGIVFSLVILAGIWKTFSKAGEPGWAAIIPIYNIYIMLKIGNNEWWWLLIIMFVPLVNIYGLYKMHAGISKAFGQGIGFTLGLMFFGFIFYPLLGFGNYQYQGRRV